MKNSYTFIRENVKHACLIVHAQSVFTIDKGRHKMAIFFFFTSKFDVACPLGGPGHMSICPCITMTLSVPSYYKCRITGSLFVPFYYKYRTKCVGELAPSKLADFLCNN